MITISIKNYEGREFIYTMPDTATIEIMSENLLDINGDAIKTGLSINVNCAAGIKTRKEVLTNENHR